MSKLFKIRAKHVVSVPLIVSIKILSDGINVFVRVCGMARQISFIASMKPTMDSKMVNKFNSLVLCSKVCTGPKKQVKSN